MKQIEFRGQSLMVSKATYNKPSNNALVVETESGEPYMTASVNPTVILGADKVGIKNWSENEGILQVLVEAKIVSKPIDWIEQGFVRIAICYLLI